MQRDLQKRPTKETNQTCLLHLSCWTRLAGMTNMSRDTHIYEQRPTKETCDRVLYIWKETHKRDLHICQKTPTYMKRDPQKKLAAGFHTHEKRPTKETYNPACCT